LPPQSWLLHLSDSTDLWCGDNVEVRQNVFFEGAWSGRLQSFDFANCADVFGSGAVRTPDGWLLVPPSHNLEAVYALRLDGGEWMASNSIAFIKQHANLLFPTSDGKLFRNFVGIGRGLEHSPHRVRCSNGEFYILHHHNALLGADGLIVQPKPWPPDFRDFSAYRDYLARTVQAVAANATDPARRTSYKLLTTISTGYDSPACAAIARTAGCTEAITFRNARGGNSDDGSAIGRQLGLSVTAFERPEVAGKSRETTAEFFATGMQGVDLVLEALRGCLAGRLFATGFLGGIVWDTKRKVQDIGGTSLGEFRLSEGFIHLPVPFIGMLRRPSILRITRSSEMQAFSIGGHYDRLIPRRIAEEAGVSRTAFGQSKKAIVILAHSNQALLSHAIRSEIEQVLANRPFRQRLVYRLRAARFGIEKFLFEKLALRVSELLPIGGGFYLRTCQRVLHAGRFPPFIEHSHPFNGLAFEWALSVVALHYAGERDDRHAETPASARRAPNERVGS
jgi:hypothetical protein